MMGGRHRSNMELIAQGAANVGASLFGGIPATGAIARTATNIKNGGRTPVAGIVHAVVLLLIMLLAGKWAALIPMPTLAGILVVVACNMSEWHSFKAVLKGSRSDIAVLLTTFLLTVLIDLTVAMEIGIVLAAFLFIREMIQSTGVNLLTPQPDNDEADHEIFNQNNIPKGVEVFEITGPMFFGAAYKFRDAIRIIEKAPEILIIRMRQVSIIDATGIKTIQEVHRELKQKHIKLVLSEVNSLQVKQSLKDARLLFAIGKANVTNTFEEALERSKTLLNQDA